MVSEKSSDEAHVACEARCEQGRASKCVLQSPSRRKEVDTSVGCNKICDGSGACQHRLLVCSRRGERRVPAQRFARAHQFAKRCAIQQLRRQKGLHDTFTEDALLVFTDVFDAFVDACGAWINCLCAIGRHFK
jgi:hypothetical protein